MELIAIILSIIASIGTIISLFLNHKQKKELDALRKEFINGERNIQSKGNNVINNTGDYSIFKS